MAVSQRIVTADPNATATATPFQPLPITPTPEITGTSTQEPSSTPGELTPTLQTITTENQVNILLLGSDFRPQAGYRTDVILWLSFQPKSGTVSMISFPRDLYVDIPGYGQNRINTAQARGGWPTMVATFQQNFGITPQYYIMTNFQGFISIVDSLGGIRVNASKNLTDKCDLPQEVNGYCSVGPGEITMDGQTALWYVRSRYSSSDFDRTRRAQEVIQALFNKMFSLDAITKAPQLYEYYQSSVETNLPLDVALSLAPMAPQLAANPEKIRHYAVGPEHVTGWVTETGASVLLPNYWAINQMLLEALAP